MGLRINSNSIGIVALRNLRLNDRQQTESLERLSSGLRVNRASDDPSQFTIAELLRAQIESSQQAIENSRNADNMVSTAEAALSQVNELLAQIRESVLASLNTGGSSRDQVSAEQDAVNGAILAIERIARATRFSTNDLLNGNAGLEVLTQFPSSGLTEVKPLKALFDVTQPQTSFKVVVLSAATQASVNLGAMGATVVASNGDVLLRVSGPLGVEVISLADGATRDDLEGALNAARRSTGAYASGGMLFSEAFGSRAQIRIEQIGGTGTYTQAMGPVTGADAVATVNGAQAAADGNHLQVISETFTGSVRLRSVPEGGAIGSHVFTLRNQSGLLFQLSGLVSERDSEILGLPSILPEEVGLPISVLGGLATGGLLSSLRSGGDNDMFSTAGYSPVNSVIDPVTLLPVDIRAANALDIVDAAIAQISDIRAFLGSFVAQTVRPNIDSLDEAVQNLTASESSIRDVDFAKETAAYTRSQVLFQAGISVLGQANLIPQTALQLLQG